MKKAIVTTTIYVPKLLDAYVADAQKHGHDFIVVVIGDKKTPPETETYCADLMKRTEVRVEYFTPERQDEYLSKFPKLREHLNWNSIQRRNVGIIYAYEEACDVIATIDDDNFLVSEDYLGTHSINVPLEATEVSTNTGWINICRLLKEAHDRTFFHRGFPLEKRLPEETWNESKKTITPVVSAGLWLGDPDVDAMERLYHLADPTEATVLSREDRVTPANGTWTTFNSQNTALARKVIPAYFLSPKVGRYDDIWGAYIVKRIADHLGDSIVFGKPVVRQERNPHNYWRDLDAERYGHALTLSFVEALIATPLSGTDYKKCYAEITEALPAKLLSNEKLKDDERSYLESYFTGMNIWCETFKDL